MGDRNSAVSFFNQALQAHGQKDNPEHLKHSYQLFSSACMADPTWFQAYYQAGNNNSDLDHLPSAIACWRRAIQCEAPDPEMAKALSNLSWRLHCFGKTAEANEMVQASIKADPTNPLSWLNLSCIEQVSGNAQASLQAAENSYALAPNNPTVELGYAFANLFARNLVKGFKHFECRFAYKLKSYLQFPYPKWLGEEGGTLYLDADQGLGDTLSFARFVPLAAKRAKYIHACVQPELLRLFAHAFIGLPNVNVVPKPAGFLPADHWSTFVSLPFALGLEDDAIRQTPDIEVPRAALPLNWKVPDRKFHIAIAWAGSPLNNINHHRSIPVALFYELYRVPGVQLYSLQCDQNRQQMYDSGGLPLIVDLSRYTPSVLDTLAVLRDVDLVITCESALGHIAGTAKRECWIPYSRMGLDYRLGLRGEDCFWYPSHRIFQQGRDDRWEPVFAEIVEALRERVS